MRSRFPLCLLVALAACGDSTTAPPRTIDRDIPRSVDEALTVDVAHPPNYTTLAWPVQYDAAVRERTNIPDSNPVTDAGALLGRVLFYDKRLSSDYRVSCASCHGQASGFTDGDRFSEGVVSGSRTAFHAMRLLNARFFSGGQAFWNRRATSLEAQALEPIASSIEMGFDSLHGGIDSVLRRLNAQPYYRALVARAYGDSTVTAERMQRSLAQFVRSIVSVDSRFDRAFASAWTVTIPDRGVTLPFAAFTSQENLGKQLFLSAPASGGAGCGTCHAVPTFALVGNSASNGLDAGSTVVFKAPSLKSVAVGGPYMHDGRFGTLARVVEFYDHEIQEGPSLDFRLRGPDSKPQRLGLTRPEKAALVAFLKTLTDDTIAEDERFSNPFRPE